MFRGSHISQRKNRRKITWNFRQRSWKGILSWKQKLLLRNRCDFLAWKVRMGERGIFVNVVRRYFMELKTFISSTPLTTLDISISFFFWFMIFHFPFVLNWNNRAVQMGSEKGWHWPFVTQNRDLIFWS